MKKLTQILSYLLAFVLTVSCTFTFAQEVREKRADRKTRPLEAGLEELNHNLQGLESGLEGLENNLQHLQPGLESLQSLHFEGLEAFEEFNEFEAFDAFDAFDAFEVYDAFQVFEGFEHFEYLGDYNSDLTDDELLKLQTLRSLVQADGKDALPMVREQFYKEENPAVRKKLIALVASLENSESVDLLSDIAASDENLSVRKRAIYYLGRSGSEKAVAVLKKILAE